MRIRIHRPLSMPCATCGAPFRPAQRGPLNPNCKPCRTPQAPKTAAPGETFRCVRCRHQEELRRDRIPLCRWCLRFVTGGFERELEQEGEP